MREYVLLSVLLLSAMWLAAQEPSSKDAKTTPAGPAPITVVGCVVGLNGGYSLTADASKQYFLNGDEAVLHRYLGQQVRVLGTADYRKKPGTNGKAENMAIRADSPQTLTIMKIEKLADTCSEKQ